MFRDSRGVVHTVSSADPVGDLPAGAVAALQAALLPTAQPVDVGGLLTAAEQVRDLLGRWQDEFFDGLPDDVDLEEEARWAAEAGLSLLDVELDGLGDEPDEAEPDDLVVAHDDRAVELVPAGEDPRDCLPESLVTALERELLLLPMRVRLEALTAADDLVQEWSELAADREKLLGHLVLAHGRVPTALDHDALLLLHAEHHAADGPAHGRTGS